MATSDKTLGVRYGARGRGKEKQASGSEPPCSALIIFAKAPIPGEVKTRLCPPLTPDEAATLHGSLVLDVLERTRLAGVHRYVAGAPSADHVFFRIAEARHSVQLLTQQGEDLGERMQHAFEAVLDYGHRKAVLIGTDVPLLSKAVVAEALAMLETHEVVLGPAMDGGYYLMGLRRVVPELFRGIAWSTERVCTVTQELAKALNLRIGLLPFQRDVDTVDDVLAFANEIGGWAQALGSKPSTALRTEDSRPRGKEKRSALQSGVLSPESSVSKRTAEVLQSLADRIRSRTSAGEARTDK
jgi:rSAM/selenodomain-associated transferase 1